VKEKILTCLKEAQDYISGQVLCGQLGVSRTAVWKVIRQLREEGWEIEAVPNRGYRLMESGDVYTKTSLKSAFHTQWLGKNLIFLEEVDSTNTEVRRLAEQGAPEGTLVIAEQQNAGKGRRGRGWVAPKGSGVWMSFLLRPEFAPERASMLTLVAAMAVSDAIYETAGLECGIKWPNDIVLNGKKVCGILTEMSSDLDTIQYVVVGIGINVGIHEFPDEIREVATSIGLCMEGTVERARLADAVARGWERWYAAFLLTSDLSEMMDTYNERLVNRGREVKVLAPGGGYTGVSHGINRTGELIVELPGGEFRNVVSGEVSVRGIYGYV